MKSRKFILNLNKAEFSFFPSLPVARESDGPQGFTTHVLYVHGEGERAVRLQEAYGNDDYGV